VHFRTICKLLLSQLLLGSQLRQSLAKGNCYSPLISHQWIVSVPALIFCRVKAGDYFLKTLYTPKPIRRRFYIGQMKRTAGMAEERAIEKALEHELRRRILRWQARHIGPASPRMMSKSLDHPLENLAYHVRVLRDAKLLDEIGQCASRGSVEHFYRLDPDRATMPRVVEVLTIGG